MASYLAYSKFKAFTRLTKCYVIFSSIGTLCVFCAGTLEPHLCLVTPSSNSTRLQVFSEDWPEQLLSLCPQSWASMEFIFLQAALGLRTNLCWCEKPQPCWLQLRSDLGANLYSRIPLQDHSLALLLHLPFSIAPFFYQVLSGEHFHNKSFVCMYTLRVCFWRPKPKTSLYSSFLLGHISYYWTPYLLSSSFVSSPFYFSPWQQACPLLRSFAFILNVLLLQVPVKLSVSPLTCPCSDYTLLGSPHFQFTIYPIFPSFFSPLHLSA